MTSKPASSYRTARRRLLIDMQIPDWDPAMLYAFDPVAVVDMARRAQAAAIMLYFQSHTGLCNWPTRTGQQHRAFLGRDVMAELLAEARRHDLPVCAYYSANFNNWAYEAHPAWRLAPVAPALIGGGLLQRERYGICCLNNEDYRAFVKQQAAEVLERYEVDAFFYDMVWWMSICVCESCRRRLREESGREIPSTIDWLDPEWCDFQAARERWLTEYACELREAARTARPGVTVYHNFALGLTNWTRGVSFESARAHDFLGGDFYGGRDEQLVVSRLMLNLSHSTPVEFMTTVTANLAEHERLKSADLLRSQCLAATASGAAFLAIAGIDPDGRCNPALIERVREAFESCIPYESAAGGTPIEEIAVYFSSASKMSFSENGSTLAQAPVNPPADYPHLHAVQGACRVLQQAHLPFGVITRRQLAQLERYAVVILPNVLRMDAEEVAALRAYVQAGGRLYASRYTSLTCTSGKRGEDFMLADVFGCRFAGIEAGRNLCLKPAEAAWAEAIRPERRLSHWIDPRERTGALRLAAHSEGRPLLTLSLPYGYPSRGSVEGRDWASIHTFPPWTDTDTPAVVDHPFGKGRAIYSAADLESGATDSHDALFLALVRALLGKPPEFCANAHPCVWMTGFDQPEQSRRLVCLLNSTRELPPVRLPAFRIQVAPPPGRTFTRAFRLPDGADIPFDRDARGVLDAQVSDLENFAMIGLTYA